MPADRIANFIIGGTEKAGTTSVFTYLSQHPEVNVSSAKETNFFRSDVRGLEENVRRQYAEFFSACDAEVPIVAEASTAYLGEAETVAPRMAALIPEVKLLFILREPVSRLYSSYNFHLSRLNIPTDMEFPEYVEQCIAFDKGELNGSRRVLDDWHLKVLSFGRYVDALGRYYSLFPKKNIKVMFFDQLKVDTAGFMAELSQFLGIDAGFWADYEFHRENVTFAPRNELLQKVALWFNTRGEAVLRRRPGLKRKLVAIYKSMNQQQAESSGIPEAAREQLAAYYRQPNAALSEMLGQNLPESWQ